MSDGTTDSSYQEAEIVFIRSCKAGRVEVNFSLVKKCSKGDAETIYKVMIEGAKNLAGDDFAKIGGNRDRCAGFDLKNGMASEPDALNGNDTPFKSARIEFLEAIIDGLQKRFTNNPGILNSCSIVNLVFFPSKDENKDRLDWRTSTGNSRCRSGKGEVYWGSLLTTCMPDADRGFNRLKLTKDDFRNKLSHSNLTDQMMIMLESQPITEYDPMPAITIWNSTPRRENEKENNPNSTENEVLNGSMNDEIVEDYELDEDYEFETLEDELQLSKDDYKNRLSDAVDVYTHLCTMMDLD
ncbi:unnamed protein product [Mytilus coruscus]|uniref:Uncharacterized protein n=1 Tax=Mytilus coruscus TaxID=42192 RepID=A0A6J8A9Q4_MYTCO|nr:unnamed protein product [Mytilus coruscus]